MDAKSIWISATQRIINSSTYKVMKKPNRKDFPNNRNGSSRYNAAVRKYNTFIKNKNKPVNTDPRPKIGDFPNREAYRQAVLKWNKKRKDKIAKQKNEELKQKGLVKTSRGLKKRKTNNSLKVKPKGPYAKDRVGQVDLTSTAYKEAKAANEKPVKYQTNQNNTSNKKDKEEKVDNNNKVKNNKLKIKSTTTGGPVKSGVEYAVSKGDDLAPYRRTKDTRITKKLKKAGFTEDRLARLRKQHAEFKARRKKKKKK